MKRKATDWEKILSNHISNKKDYYLEYIKNSQNSTLKTKQKQRKPHKIQFENEQKI